MSLYMFRIYSLVTIELITDLYDDTLHLDYPGGTACSCGNAVMSI